MPLRQNDLHPPAGAKRDRKRLGRGNASGTGTYSGKGLKGQKARSGGGVRPGFEGGQVPMIRRMAHKRGFTNRFKIHYTPLNVFTLGRCFAADAAVTPETLVAAGLLANAREPYKILGGGALAHALRVEAPMVSGAARVKIEAAGGSVHETARKEPARTEDTNAASAERPGADEA